MTDRKLTISEMWIDLSTLDNYRAEMGLIKRHNSQKEK